MHGISICGKRAVFYKILVKDVVDHNPVSGSKNKLDSGSSTNTGEDRIHFQTMYGSVPYPAPWVPEGRLYVSLDFQDARANEVPRKGVCYRIGKNAEGYSKSISHALEEIYISCCISWHCQHLFSDTQNLGRKEEHLAISEVGSPRHLLWTEWQKTNRQ